jgi:formylmethanofuran dehydrogenase subunit E
MTSQLSELLKLSSARHSHLCPRQVLGVRMGLVGLKALGITSPISKQTGLVIVETDGCFADGIEVATGATVGHRTLRVNDLGKIAATFVNVGTGKAIRFSPQPDVRDRAVLYAPEIKSRYYAQLHGYQSMPESELLRREMVVLQPSLIELLSKPSARARCSQCGDEIINDRQVDVNGVILCRSCASMGYYLSLND